MRKMIHGAKQVPAPVMHTPPVAAVPRPHPTIEWVTPVPLWLDIFLSSPGKPSSGAIMPGTFPETAEPAPKRRRMPGDRPVYVAQRKPTRLDLVINEIQSCFVAVYAWVVSTITTPFAYIKGWFANATKPLREIDPKERDWIVQELIVWFGALFMMICCYIPILAVAIPIYYACYRIQRAAVGLEDFWEAFQYYRATGDWGTWGEAMWPPKPVIKTKEPEKKDDPSTRERMSDYTWWGQKKEQWQIAFENPGIRSRGPMYLLPGGWAKRRMSAAF